MLEQDVEKARKELLERWQKVRPSETPVIFANVNGQDIAIKDESQNITDTYKAKHGWMMGLHYLQTVFPNPFVYFLGSTGNAGIADFAFADMLNEMLGEKKVVVANFFPLHYDRKLLGPDSMGRFTDGKRFREAMEQSRSGRLIQVDFKEKYWFGQPCLDKMNELGMRVTSENSMDITEGFKPTYTQVMKEFVKQIKARYGYVPRTLAIVQFGAGMLYDDSKAVVQERNLPIDLIAVSTGNTETIADKICDSSQSWQESLSDLRDRGFTRAKNSRDRIYQVGEQEILYALMQFRQLGIESEPSGAAGMAIVPRIKEIITKPYDLVAVINTGNGIMKCAYDSIVSRK
jgi:hypothetical protein